MTFHKIALAIATLGLSASAFAATVDVNINPGDSIQSFTALSTTGPTNHFINFNLASGYTYDLSITLSSSYTTQNGGMVYGYNPGGISAPGASAAFTTTSGSFVYSGITFVSSNDNAAFNVFGLGPGQWQMIINGVTADSGTLNGTVDVKRATAITPVPEPETYAMMLAGLGVVGFIARRRKAA